MEGSLVQQGLALMAFGMGVVFVFLIVLVFATTWMSALVQRFSPPASEPVSPGIARQDNAVDPTVLAAITAAIHQHRKRK